MAQWVRCTRKLDSTEIFINLDTVTWLRRSEDDSFTFISWAQGDENLVRVLERPEQIFSAFEDAVSE